MKRTRKNRGATRTRDPTVVVTVDSGSHINGVFCVRDSGTLDVLLRGQWASATWTRRDQSFLQNRHTERAYGSRYCDAAHKQQGTPIPVYDASKKCG